MKPGLDKDSYDISAQQFTVTEADITEQGALSLCRILSEITRLYDQAILRKFGVLDFDTITTSAYNVNITGPAFLGDTVLVESHGIVSENNVLELLVFVERSNSRERVVIAEGSFNFQIANPATTKLKSHYSHLVLS